MRRTKKTESVFALTLVCFFCIIRRIKNQLINCAVAIYIYKHCDRSWIFPLHIGFNLIVANVFKLFFLSIPMYIGIVWISYVLLILFLVWFAFLCHSSSSSCLLFREERPSCQSLILLAAVVLSLLLLSRKFKIKYFCSFSSSPPMLLLLLLLYWSNVCLMFCVSLSLNYFLLQYVHTLRAARFKTLSGNCIHNSSHNDRINYWWPTISAYFLLSLFLVYTRRNLLTLN